MSDINIGSIVAYVKLDLSQLNAGTAEAIAAVGEMSSAITAEISAMSTEVTAAISEMTGVLKAGFSELAATLETSVAGMSASIEASFAEMTEAVTANTAAMSEAAGTASAGFSGMVLPALAVVAALGEIVKVGSDTEQMFLHLQANTNSTDEQMQGIIATVQELGSKTGAPLKELADGMMHVTNFGFAGAEAMKILDAATQSAIATGADAGKTANLLAATLHEFSMSGNDAAAVMNVLHTAAAKGNMTLEEFVASAGTAYGAAANMGVSIGAASAALTTLTQHGYNASEAVTQFKGILLGIALPSEKVTKYIAGLGDAGKILQTDFTQAGLRTKDLSGVLADIDGVAKATGRDASEMAMHLITARRGGLGAMTLLGTGAQDLTKHFSENADMLNGKATPALDGYNKEQQTLNVEMGKLKNNAQMAASAFYNAWAPVLAGLAKMAASLSEAFAKLLHSPDATAGKSPEQLGREVRDRQVAAAGARYQQQEAARNLFPVPNMFTGAQRQGPNAAVENAGMLSNVPKTSKGFHFDPEPISEKLQQALDTAFESLHSRFDVERRDAKRTYHSGMDQAGDNTAAKHMLNAAYAADMKRIAEEEGKAKEAAGNKAGKAAKEQEREADKAAKAVDDLSEKIKRLADRAYAATHSDYEVSVRDAKQQYSEDLGDAKGNPKAKQMALEVYQGALKKAHDEAKKLINDEVKQMMDAGDKVAEFYAKNKLKDNTASDKVTEDAFKAQIAGYEHLGKALQDYGARVKKAADAEMEQRILATGLKREQENEAAAEAKQIEANGLQYEVKIGYLSLQSYLEIMKQKLLSLKAYTDAWMQVQNVIEETQKKIDDALKQAQAGQKSALDKMKDDAKSLLEDGLSNAFQHGFKNFFKGILQSFDQLLAQMMAKALVSGIFNLLSGGGMEGFLGKGTGGGLLGTFGFDDGGNDRAAGRWGWDFASVFSRGVTDFMSQRNPMQRAAGHAGAAGSGHHTTVNMYGDQHYHNDMDAQKVGDAVAWHSQNRMVVSRQPKG